MRVLLDEQLPRQLVPYLTSHDVRTLQQEGWAGLKNGELLNALEDLLPAVPKVLAALGEPAVGRIVRVVAVGA